MTGERSELECKAQIETFTKGGHVFMRSWNPNCRRFTIYIELRKEREHHADDIDEDETSREMSSSLKKTTRYESYARAR